MANMEIKPGDLIYRELPYVCVLSDKELKKLCSYCFNSVGQLKQCSSCKILKYCNSSCQKGDWQIHKLECQCFKNVAPNFPTQTFRMFLRILIRYQNGDHNKVFSTDLHWKRPFSDLMSHSESMLQDKLRSEGFAHFMALLPRLLGDRITLPSDIVLWEFFGKMVINSFTIRNELTGDLIGTGLYLGASLLDHRCSANAVVTFSGKEIIVRAIEPISQAVPNQVFIGYIQNDVPSWERKELSQEHYYFTCICTRCTTDLEDTDRQMTSMKCPNSQCKGFTGIKNISEEVCQLWPCVSCQETDFPIKYIHKVGQLWRDNRKKVKSLREMYDKGDMEGSLEFAEQNLGKIQDSEFHESNINIVAMMDVAKDACLALQMWEKAAEYWEKVLLQVSKYSTSYQITDGLSHLRLARQQICLKQITKAQIYLKKAEKIISITHGSDSLLYQELTDAQQTCDVLLAHPLK